MIMTLVQHEKTNRWHVAVFKSVPIPVDRLLSGEITYKSVACHREGFDTKEDAESELRDKVKESTRPEFNKIHLTDRSDIIVSWNGEGPVPDVRLPYPLLIERQ